MQITNFSWTFWLQQDQRSNQLHNKLSSRYVDGEANGSNG